MPLPTSSSSRIRVALLGATGSIGENALRVIAAHPDKLELVAIASRGQWEKLARIATQFRVPHVGIFDSQCCAAARQSGAFPAHTTFHSGLDGLNTLACMDNVDTVLVAVVGTTGLQPALGAIRAGKTLALASKEILVLAGKFVMEAARKANVRLLPVDSEHNAVFQCLEGHPTKGVRRIILTASGGAFRDWPLERLSQVTPADALKHPNWAMGPKITVDSATLANKGLELIEAQCLFGLRANQCDAVIHPQSIVHSLVEFEDGSLLSQLCPPSMTFPIQHALLYPRRAQGVEAPINMARPFSLDFRPIDEGRYPMLSLARQAMREGGTAPAVYNAANEVAVSAFLDGRIPFLAIPSLVDKTLQAHPSTEPGTLDQVLAVDQDARRTAVSFLPA